MDGVGGATGPEHQSRGDRVVKEREGRVEGGEQVPKNTQQI